MRIASFDAAARNRNDATVHLQAIINNRRDFRGQRLAAERLLRPERRGLDATSAPTSTGFAKVMSEVRRIFSADRRTRVEVARFADVSGNTELGSGVLDVLDETTVRLVPDVNLNRQADRDGRGCTRSPRRLATMPSISFLVDQFFEHPDLLAGERRRPGPSIVQGTSRSGVAAAVRGGLDEQRDPDLIIALRASDRGELAGYLGAPPTADRTQLSAEQAFVVLHATRPLPTDAAERIEGGWRCWNGG